MVAVCEQEQFPYAVMGGLAVRVHGIPRPTYDVDFQLTVNEEQLNRFIERTEARNYSIAEQYVAGCDVADILFVQGELDQEYMRKWSRPLGIESQLEQALATSH